MTAETSARFQDLVTDIVGAGEEGKVYVSLGEIFDAIGTRSFGGLLLVPSLLTTSPLSGVPGVPSVSGILIVIICAQYVVGREHIWMPQWILRKEVDRKRVSSALRVVQPVARFVDRFIYPRLSFLINRVTFTVIATVCALLAATMPPLEILPFTATIAGFIIALFAIALIASDGLLAGIAMVGTFAAVAAFMRYVAPQIASLFS